MATGVTINYVLSSDNPNEGRVKINDNFTNKNIFII